MLLNIHYNKENMYLIGKNNKLLKAKANVRQVK